MINPLRWILVLLVVALASGCASTPGGAKRIGTVYEKREVMEVEVEGTAYLGDEDTLQEVRDRAWANALERAIAKGAHTEVTQSGAPGAAPRTDAAVTASITDVEVLDEGLEGRQYRMRVRALIEPRPAAASALADLRPTAPAQVAPPESIEPSRPPEPAATRVIPAARPAARTHRPSQSVPTPKPVPVAASSRVTVPDGYVDGTTLCCTDFPSTLAQRITTVLVNAPGVTRVTPVAGGPNQYCYHLQTDADPGTLRLYLERHLRTSGTQPFQVLADASGYRLNLVHDGGFD